MAKGIFRFSKDKTEYRDYPFEGYPMPGASNSQTKQILRIRFTGETPADGPFYSGREYCLKIVTVYSRRTGRPADRDYWDAADFRGDHLMHHIALDENGDTVSGQLRREGRIDESMDGRKIMILEPDGISLFDLINDNLDPNSDFISLKTLPVSVRLDILDQICEGLQELYHHVQRDGRRIVSYRDLKEENAVILLQNGRMLVQLIDFATIRLEDSEGVSTNRTFKSQFSESNTAPEDIIPENDPVVSFYVTNGQNEKTDVFALGMILGRLFSNCRPLRDWINKAQMTETDSEKLWLHAYESVISRYQYRDFRWLERELQDGFQWQNEIDSKILTKIQRLFRQSTLLWPDSRPGITAFRERLNDLLEMAISSETPSEEGPVNPPLPPEREKEEDGEEKKEESGMEYTVFLVNTSVPAEMIGSYRLAMEDAWRKELKKHRRTGAPASKFVTGFVRFRAGSGIDASYAETEFPLGVYTYENFMDNVLSANTRFNNTAGSCAQGMKDAFHLVESYLRDDSSLAFTGTVYIFTPTVPSPAELEEVLFQDAMEDCEHVSRERHDRQLHIVIYSDPGKRSREEPADWYDERDLRITGIRIPGGRKAEGRNTARVNTDSWGQDPYDDPAGNSASRRSDVLHIEDEIYFGTGALYVQAPQGREIYVLRRKPQTLPDARERILR